MSLHLLVVKPEITCIVCNDCAYDTKRVTHYLCVVGPADDSSHVKDKG